MTQLRPLKHRHVADPVHALQRARRLLANPARRVKDGRKPAEGNGDGGVIRVCPVGAVMLPYANNLAHRLVVRAYRLLGYNVSSMAGPSGRRLNSRQIDRVYAKAIELAKEARW